MCGCVRVHVGYVFITYALLSFWSAEVEMILCVFLVLNWVIFSLPLSLSRSLSHTQMHALTGTQMCSCVLPCFCSFEKVTARSYNSSNVLSCSALDHNFMLVSRLICCPKEGAMLS